MTPEFTAEQDIRYSMLIGCHRTIEEVRINCLLGMVDSRRSPMCGGDCESLDVAWTLLRQGEALATRAMGTWRSGLYGDRIAREIGDFDARKADRYTITWEIRREGSDLNLTHPQFLVQTYPSAWKGPALEAFADEMLRRAGIALCLLMGVLLWVVPPAVRLVRSTLR